jgi:hypothetical protein
LIFFFYFFFFFLKYINLYFFLFNKQLSRTIVQKLTKMEAKVARVSDGQKKIYLESSLKLIIFFLFIRNVLFLLFRRRGRKRWRIRTSRSLEERVSSCSNERVGGYGTRSVVVEVVISLPFYFSPDAF